MDINWKLNKNFFDGRRGGEGGGRTIKKSTLTQDLLSEYFCWIVLNFGCNEPVIITEWFDW